MVGFGFGYSGKTCHTTATEQVYPWAGELPSFVDVTVTTFLPVQTYDDELGTVRLWRGASDYVERRPQTP